MNYSKFVLLITISIFFGQLSAQSEEIPLQGFTFLRFDNAVPKDLLSTRTAVFIRSKNNFKALANQVHTVLRNLGIDAVAYYDLETIRAGEQATQAFATGLAERKIENILLVEKGEANPSYTLILSNLNDENFFFRQGQSAWKTESRELDAALMDLTKAVSSSGQKISNHLILEKPEFFHDTDLIANRRFEDYNPDLKLDKLAVPIFEKVVIPAQVQEGGDNRKLMAAIKQHNDKLAEKNEALKNIIQGHYPFKSEPIEYSKGEDELKQEGFQFILLKLCGPSQTVKRLLDYKKVTNASSNNRVCKYYVKHLLSGEVYLGSKWDAAPTWEEALRNHINNMKDDLNVQ